MNLRKQITDQLDAAFAAAHTAECAAAAHTAECAAVARDASVATDYAHRAKLAIETARALLHGEDPETGEPLTTTFIEVTEVRDRQHLSELLSDERLAEVREERARSFEGRP